MANKKNSDLKTASGSGCCSPVHIKNSSVIQRESRSSMPATALVIHDQVSLPGGTFFMGDAFDEGYEADGEQPIHEITVSPFQIDLTAVTNEMFAVFVTETNYETEAEAFGTSAVFHLLAKAPREDILGVVEGAPWWLNVRGADWAHPGGRNSTYLEFLKHPVVHVSHTDALAYCAWSGRRLPSEAEWEYAARGGLQSKRYPWGDQLLASDGSHLCNIWQGKFPTLNTKDDGHLGTAPVRSFPANNFGLFEVGGNVWEWCADWFSPGYYKDSPIFDPVGPVSGKSRVMRGGSYLCHNSYCNRYRVAARSSNTPDSSTGNCGFRTVSVAQD